MPFKVKQNDAVLTTKAFAFRLFPNCGLQCKLSESMPRKENDLGSGALWPLALRLAVPTALAQSVNVLYQIVDRMFIGHIPVYGDIALSSVGVAAPLATLLSSVTFLIGMGGAPLMAMKEGHGDREEALDLIATGFYLLAAAAALLTPLFLLLRRPLLLSFGASASTLPYAEDYLSVYLLGTPFALLSVGMNNFIVNQGLSGKGMLSVMTGAVLNLLLDPLFIFVFGMGVKGAAAATVLSEMAAAAVTLSVLLSRKTTLRLSLRRFSPRYCPKILKLGFSPFIIMATDSLVLILVNSTLQRYGGPEEGDLLITCSTIIQSYHTFFMNTLGGITGGCQGLVSYNYGSGDEGRVKGAIARVRVMAALYAFAMLLLALLFSKPYASLFTSNSATASLAARYLIVFESGILILSQQYTNVDMLTAMAQVRYSLSFSLGRKLVFLIAVLALPSFLGAPAVFLAEPISDVLSGVISTIITALALPGILRKRRLGGLGV